MGAELVIPLIVTSLVASAAGTGVSIHQAQQAKQMAEDQAEAARESALASAQVRSQAARAKLRQQLAAQTAQAAGGPVGLLGTEQQGFQTARDILGGLRAENLQEFQQAGAREQQALNEAFLAEQEGIQAGLEGTSQILSQGAGMKFGKPKGSGTTGFTGKNNAAINTTGGFTGGKYA